MTRREALALARAAQKAGLRATALERFWQRVKKGSSSECWIWQGSILKSRGYGMVSWNGKQKYAHRIALSLTDGDWDSRMVVCHTCDNPPCCNPNHLWRGTQLANMRDKTTKGRNVVAGNAGRQGQTNGNSKLTKEQVLAIRQSTAPQKALMAEYGLSRVHIFRIKKFRTWRDTP